MQLVPGRGLHLLVDERDAQKLLEAQERSDAAKRRALAATYAEEDRELFLRRYYYNQTAGADRAGKTYERQYGPQPARPRAAGAEDGITERRRSRLKISVQSLFEDYEEDAVPLSRDTDAERILEKTRAKLPRAAKSGGRSALC